MTDAADKIIEIIEKVESDNGLPKGILKEIYDQELTQVHRDVRTSYVDKSLRELITKYYNKENENQNNRTL